MNHPMHKSKCKHTDSLKIRLQDPVNYTWHLFTSDKKCELNNSVPSNQIFSLQIKHIYIHTVKKTRENSKNRQSLKLSLLREKNQYHVPEVKNIPSPNLWGLMTIDHSYQNDHYQWTQRLPLQTEPSSSPSTFLVL